MSESYRYPRRWTSQQDPGWLWSALGLFCFSQVCYHVVRTRAAVYNPADMDRQVLYYARWRFPGYFAFWGAAGCVLMYYTGSPFTFRDRCREALDPFAASRPWLAEMMDSALGPKYVPPPVEEVPIEYR
eukprot:s340_g12.t1